MSCKKAFVVKINLLALSGKYRKLYSAQTECKETQVFHELSSSMVVANYICQEVQIQQLLCISKKLFFSITYLFKAYGTDTASECELCGVSWSLVRQKAKYKQVE